MQNLSLLPRFQTGSGRIFEIINNFWVSYEKFLQAFKNFIKIFMT
jgi:hypothetical protein